VSGWFLNGKEQLLARTIPPEAGVFVVGVNEDYVFDDGQVDFSVVDPTVILPEIQLTEVTFTGGILNADNVKWLAAGAGITDISLNLLGVIVYFKLDDTGSLLAFIDRAVVGLPQTLTGVNVTAYWDARGILKL
jgi:hypothetical protein